MSSMMSDDGNGSTRPLQGRRLKPAVAPMLRDRSTAILVTAVLLAQTGLSQVGLSGWQCPVFHTIGIPCPGCGMSRAAAMFLRGDWENALRLHAFAPVLLLAIAVSILASVLPEPRRMSLVHLSERAEARTGVTYVVLFGLLLYWGIRMVTGPQTFIEQIAGQ